MIGHFRKARDFWNRTNSARRARLILAAAAAVLLALLIGLPKPGQTDDAAKIGQWWGALVSLGLVAILAICARWWTRSSPGSCAYVRLSAPRWFWPLVALAMLGTAIMGSMRLNHDLWDDEDYTLRVFVQGSYKPVGGGDDGTVEFREVGPGRVFHDYRKPNNHILHSILARISVTLWKPFRDPLGAPFSEAALRLPAFFFGIASIAAVALLLKEIGLARAGILAAFTMALHPWHIRYASEARGYSMVLFFLPLLLVFWIRAISSGCWRWWIAVAATSFALLYTYPATLYPVAFLNLVTLFAILVRRTAAGMSTMLARWFASSTVAAALFIFLFSPCVPQLLDYLAKDQAHGNMGGWWLQEFGSQLFAGMAWFKSKSLTAPHPELFTVAAENPFLFRLVFFAAMLFVIAGAIRLAARGFLSAAVALTLTVPANVAYFAALNSGTFLYEWYLIYLLPGAVVLFAVGIDSTALAFSRKPRANAVATITLCVFLCGYVWLTRDARKWLLSRALQPMKDSVLLTRESTLPNYHGHHRVITASFNTPAFLYDPHGVKLKTMEELQTLMQRSKTTGIPLYLNIGNPWAASFHQPEMYKIMTESNSFEVLAHLPGYDPTLDRIVARYNPRSP